MNNLSLIARETMQQDHMILIEKCINWRKQNSQDKIEMLKKKIREYQTCYKIEMKATYSKECLNYVKMSNVNHRNCFMKFNTYSTV